MDAAGVEECYRKHAEALVRFAATQVGPSDADDLLASVMTALLAAPDRVIGDPRAYRYRSVANAARRHWRTLDRRARRDCIAVAAEAVEHHEFFPEVIRALAGLSPQQRAMVHLAYWEDLTVPAIAARLGVADGSVRRQLVRARLRLKEPLNGLA